MAQGGDKKLFRNMVFWQPRFHDSDHRAILALIMRGRPGRLKLYRQYRQTFPLQLPPVEEQDEQMRLFGELQKTWEEDVPTWRKRNKWILEESWPLIALWAMLHRTGRLCQTGGRCLHRQIGASLCKDQADQMAMVGSMVEAELAGGNVQEAFCLWQNHAITRWSTRLWNKSIFMRGGSHQVTPYQLMSPKLKSTMTLHWTASYGK
jgi:hypothetical protein